MYKHIYKRDIEILKTKEKTRGGRKERKREREGRKGERGDSNQLKQLFFYEY
jgi:hypothetical protein